jgi:hypothetical protein
MREGDREREGREDQISQRDGGRQTKRRGEGERGWERE